MEKNTIKIEFEIEIIQEQCDEMFSCYIPITNTYFSARSYEEAKRRGELLIKSFIKYWNQYNLCEQSEDFSSTLHKQWINGE